MVSNSWREITHLWYLDWPDKGVPNEANSLIAYLIEARSFIKTNEHNSVSSCSDTPISKTIISWNSIYISNCLKKPK